MEEMEKFVDENEVSKQSGLTVRMIRDLRAKADFPFYKIGKLVRFRISEVDKWLKKHQAS